MNTKSFLLLWCLCVTLSLPLFAGLTQKQLPCADATCIPLFVGGPNDGPAQDGKDPTTPNQFAVRLEDRTLVVTTTLDEAVSLKLQDRMTKEYITNLTFIRSACCSIAQYGSYILTLQVGNTTLTGLFDVELSQDEVADIALKRFKKDSVEIFVSDYIYEPGDTIHVLYEQLHNEYIVAENRCWVAFVDLIPDANWGHECQYLLIDAKSGKIVAYNRDMSPKNQDFFKQYKAFDRIKVLNQQDAFEIVDSIYKKDTVAIYISKKNYYGGETFELLNKDVIRVPYPLSMYWVFFVDLYPMENWGHPCEYIFIDAYSGQVTILRKTMFPKNQEELFTLKRWDYRQNIELVLPTDAAYSSLNTKKKRLSLDSLDSSEGTSSPNSEYHKWAIVISGGCNRNKNFMRYWNDCSAVYMTLLNSGYNPDQIFVAISDGLDDNADMFSNWGVYINSPWDLDGNGTNDVQFSATRRGVEAMFNMVRNTMSPGDEIFIFTTDHGSKIDNNVVLCLWNDECMYDFEFANLVNNLNAGIVNVVMEQCYSGGFIDDFRSLNFNQIVVSTACSEEQKSWSRYDYTYDEFIYWWCTAVNGMTPDGRIVDTADYDNDGYISMQEAYVYASLHDVCDESPQQFSNDDCLKYELTLTDVLSLCDSPIMVDGYDLYIKDNAADFGEEPNVSTDKSWISTDIWFETINGEVTNTLQSGMTYKVCARVHNRGNQPSPGGELIYWHWTKAMIGGSWPYSWFADYEYSCDDTPIIRGAMINPSGTPLPSINGGESYVAYAYWTAPNIDYSVCSVFNDNLSELWHYCLLARIVDAQSAPGEDDSAQLLAPFVLDNNNVVSRNFSMIRDNNISADGLPASVVGIAAPYMMSGDYHIYCDVLNTNIEWGGNVHLYLTLHPDMYSNWSMNGCGYLDINGQGLLEITASHAELLDIYMDGNNFYPIKVEIADTTSSSHNITFDIYLVDTGGAIIGGERFMYSSNGANVVEAPNSDGRQLPILHPRMISCVPNPVTTNTSIVSSNKILWVDIYNVQGQNIISTSNTTVDVSELSKGIYIIRAEMENGYNQTKFIKQ